MAEPPDPVLHALGLRVRRARERRRLSMETLAERAGMSVRGLTYLEHGRKDPRYGTLVAVAAALDVSVCDLISDA